MMTLLYIYLGGVALRAYLVHAMMQSQLVESFSVDRQMFGCLIWPMALLLFGVFKK